MTFAEFLADAQARGFTHVLTYGGPVALTDWHPYGLFGGPNSRPGCTVEATFQLRWINDHEATDARPDGPQAPFVAGVWTFTRPELEPDLGERQHVTFVSGVAR